jgi:hypothetical protein
MHSVTSRSDAVVQGVLLDDDFAARSCAASSGYTAARAAHAYSDGVPYFECQVVNLAKDGYVFIGLGGPDMGECNTHIPDERFDHYGVASSGDACGRPLDVIIRCALRSLVCSYVRGLLVKENLPRFGEGDRVGFMINFAQNQVLYTYTYRRVTAPPFTHSASQCSKSPLHCPLLQVTFYLNDTPVVEFSDLPEDFWASVVFGAAGYLVRINPVPRLPLGVTRWSEDALQPYR